MAKKKSGALTVDPDNMDLDNLEDHEARWLQDRGELPDSYEPVPVTFQLPDGGVVSNDPLHFAQVAESANVLDDNPHLEAEIERRAKAMVEQLMRDQQQGSINVGGEHHGNALNEPQHASVAGRSNIVPEPSNDEVPEEEEEDVEEDDDEEEVDYANTNVDDLRAELSRRGLSVEGKKAELIDRLEEDDDKE